MNGPWGHILNPHFFHAWPPGSPRLRRALSALPLLYPSDETWTLIDEWVERAGRRGHRFGLGDLLIGALASQVGALVWSLDADFARLERLKLVHRYEP